MTDDAAESLWRLFHDARPGFAAGGVRPALLFDQFEEIFTLGLKRRADAAAFRDALACLAENRVPAPLRARLEESDDDATSPSPRGSTTAPAPAACC